MADAKTVDPTKELEELIAAARKIEHNFVMMKTKEGVAIEASKVKSVEGLIPLCKAKGGMAAMSVSGVMKVDGKVMNLRAAEEDVPRALPRLAKKHFKALGVKCKVVIQLPGGGMLDDEDEDETGSGETQKVSDGIVAPVEAVDEAPDLKAELTERLRALVPQVKAAADQALAGAEKLVAAVKAAGAELAAGGLDRAGKLLDAVEAGLKSAGPSEDPAALRAQLENDFKMMRGDLQRLLAEGAPQVAGKARTVAQMFATEIGRDLKKAGQALGVLRGFLSAEVAKLGVAKPQATGVGDLGDDLLKGMGDLAERAKDTLSEVTQSVVEGATRIKEGVEDFVGGMTATTQDKSDIAMLNALGLSREDRIALIDEWKKDPAKAKTYKTKLMSDAKVPEDRREALLKLQAANPAAFLATLATLKGIDAEGKVDASPAGLQDALDKAETARRDLEAKAKLLADAQKALETGKTAVTDTARTRDTARLTAANAAQAIKDLEARVGDIAALTPEQRKAFQEENIRLINANEAAKKALADAEKAATAAANEERRLQGVTDKAGEAHQKSAATYSEADKKLEQGRAKKGLLDAVSFGPLSADAKPPLKDADRAALAGVFATDSGLAEKAMATARNAKDPSVVAQNAAFVAGKFKDGFADGTGKKLDLAPDQMRAMAGNALQMGAQMGDGYFKGLDEYLKSGKQFDADPHGGMDKPLADPKAETVRRKNVAQSRARGAATAALAPDGTVDFSTPEARAATDAMLFHPGALTVFTPQMNMKVAETQALFSDPATKDRAQGLVKDTKLPGPGTLANPTSPASAKKIIGGSMGKDPAAVTDTDARASVLSAMMTPLSQGPVGSCFSTAPVRAIRETEPLKAMEEYSKIASTGMFKPEGKPAAPANTRAHDGENPLLRSWEYSVATAAANEKNSVEQRRLTYGAFRDDDKTHNMEAIRGIMGADDGAWYGTVNTVTNDVTEGLKSKLIGAMLRNLPFVYNPTAPKAGGGGDGRSEEGRYELMYKGNPIRSEADFTDAMSKIALGVTGETPTSVKGAQIVTLITSPAFVTSVKDALKPPTGGGKDYEPWKLESGGFEDNAQKMVKGGTPKRDQVLDKPGTPAPSRSDRTKDILGAIIGKHGDMPGDMHMLATSGDNAGHAFNALPKDPSMDKIRDPDSAAKIQRELIEPGARIASTKLPAAQAARFFQDEVEAFMKGQDADGKAALVKALKNAPTADMTPAEIGAKVQAEVKAALCPVWADAYVKRREPAANNARKGEILTFFQNEFDKNEGKTLGRSMQSKMMDALQPPQVVVADSNWGGSEKQDYFVAAPDPMTGDLIMWSKTEPGGKMVPLGQNWEDGPWHWIKP